MKNRIASHGDRPAKRYTAATIAASLLFFLIIGIGPAAGRATNPMLPFNAAGYDGELKIIPQPAPNEQVVSLRVYRIGDLDHLTYGGALVGIVKTINEQYRFPNIVPIRTGSCKGSETAAYDPTAHQILLCEEFRQKVAASIMQVDGYPDIELLNGTLVVRPFPRRLEAGEADYLATRIMAFIGTHEIGHALINELKIPTTGSEEDDADEVAALFIGNNDMEEDFAWEAVMWLRSQTAQDPKTLRVAEYRDKHGLNGTRAENLECLLYGQHPNGLFSGIATSDPLFTDARRRNCVAEFKKKSTAWTTLLCPYREFSNIFVVYPDCPNPGKPHPTSSSE